MKAECFLDSNVVVYAFSAVPAEASKRRRAELIMESHIFGISAQVLAETFVVLTRKSHIGMKREDAVRVIRSLSGVPCVAVDFALVEAGIAMSERYQTSYWDGAILAAAERLGVKTVYSEDLTDGQCYGSVTVENPFRGL